MVGRLPNREAGPGELEERAHRRVPARLPAPQKDTTMWNHSVSKLIWPLAALLATAHCGGAATPEGAGGQGGDGGEGGSTGGSGGSGGRAGAGGRGGSAGSGGSGTGGMAGTGLSPPDASAGSG